MVLQRNNMRQCGGKVQNHGGRGGVHVDRVSEDIWTSSPTILGYMLGYMDPRSVYTIAVRSVHEVTASHCWHSVGEFPGCPCLQSLLLTW